MESLFDQIRSACRTVAEQARWVRINEDLLGEYAASLPLDAIRRPTLDADSHYLGHGADTAAFVVTLDAINFGSGYFPHLRKRPGMSGYFTIAASLADRFRAQGPLTPEELAALTDRDCAKLFGQSLANPAVLELMDLFATALNELGRYVLDAFDGRFARLIEAASGSAEQLARLLAEMPYFMDVETHAGVAVPFFKRAQLTSADLALAFDGEGLGRFDDLDRLTIFADNLVPHVLRIDGLLSYDEDLAARIDREELIPAGSAEEVEIRACAVHAVERMVDELQAAGTRVAAMQLDYLLWNRGQQPHYKKIKPRHRTRTVYY